MSLLYTHFLAPFLTPGGYATYANQWSPHKQTRRLSNSHFPKKLSHYHTKLTYGQLKSHLRAAARTLRWPHTMGKCQRFAKTKPNKIWKKHIQYKTQREENNQIHITIDRQTGNWYANSQKQFMKRKMLTMGESYTPRHSGKKPSKFISSQSPKILDSSELAH